MGTLQTGCLALGIAVSVGSCAGKSAEDELVVRTGDEASPADEVGNGGSAAAVPGNMLPSEMRPSEALPSDPPPADLPVDPPPMGTGGGTGNPPADGLDLACAADALAGFPGYTNVALYHFEETRGARLRDSSGLVPSGEPVLGLGEGGTVVGARRAEGHCGRGLSLAADAHAELSPVGPLFDDGIAVGIWVRPTSIFEAESHLVGDGGGGVASFQLVLDAGYPVFRLSDTEGNWNETLRSSTPLLAGIWQHISVSYEPGLGSLSLDGNEVATTDVVRPVPGSYNIIAVGGILNASSCCSYHNQFDGDIDEVSIFAL